VVDGVRNRQFINAGVLKIPSTFCIVAPKPLGRSTSRLLTACKSTSKRERAIMDHQPVTSWETDYDHTHPDHAANALQIWDDLRSGCPVAHSERFGGMWVPTRHDDIAMIAANADGNYTSQGVVVSEVRPTNPAPVGDAPPITSDPPFHKIARSLLLPAFAPKPINALEPFTRAFCHELIDQIEARGAAEVDAAVEYAQHIPVRIIAHMLGLPAEDGDLFREFIHRIIEAPVERPDLDPEDTLDHYLDTRIAEHRGNPRSTEDGDLIDFLINARIDGNGLADEHIRGTIALLLIAGIDTTWSAIGSSLWHLAQHPEDRARYVSEPDIRMFAHEEFLRAYAPVTMARIAAKDHDLRGCPVQKGDWLLLPFPAANRDPEMFENPDEVVLDRQANRHAAFGLGIHRCLGSNMARMELSVAIEVWMERLPNFELIDPATVRFSAGQIRGPRELPVRLL